MRKLKCYVQDDAEMRMRELVGEYRNCGEGVGFLYDLKDVIEVKRERMERG